MDMRELGAALRVELSVIEAWMEAGWIVPSRQGDDVRFSDREVARARLIQDLGERMGVNAEGIAVVLDLLDQVHGLRFALRRLSACLAALPDAQRAAVLAGLRAVEE